MSLVHSGASASIPTCTMLLVAALLSGCFSAEETARIEDAREVERDHQIVRVCRGGGYPVTVVRGHRTPRLYVIGVGSGAVLADPSVPLDDLCKSIVR